MALLMFVAAWSLAERGRRRHCLTSDLDWAAAGVGRGANRLWSAWSCVTRWMESVGSPAAAVACALAIAATVLVTSVRHAQFVAGASDAWGYVGQASMWRPGLRTPQPLMVSLRDVLPSQALAPLAYRPSLDETGIAPVTSPGLPMLMGVFQIIGGPAAVFAVVPLLAGVAVWATFLLGRALAGRWTGVIAAALLATSPAFLFQLTSAPMSDIPAAAFWTLSLTAAIRGHALWSGIAAGIAVLIRANLAPLAIVPAAILLVPNRDGSRPSDSPARSTLRQLIPFAAGVVPAALTIAVLYTYWYGSPLQSGYGTLNELYGPQIELPLGHVRIFPMAR